jgi:hypothetical protein
MWNKEVLQDIQVYLSRNGSLDDKQAFPTTEDDTAYIPYEI